MTGVQEDPRLTTTCELSEQLDRDYRCWVTAGLTCNGAIFVGPGSVCQHRHSDLRVYKCQAGKWMDSDGVCVCVCVRACVCECV